MNDSEFINGYPKEKFIAWQLAIHGNPHTGELPDPYYFFRDFVYTFDEEAANRGLIPYQRFPIDKIHLATTLDYLENRGEFASDYYRNNIKIIVKSRQITMTWFVLDYILYKLIARPGIRAASIAQKGEKTEEHSARMWHTIKQFDGGHPVGAGKTEKENQYIANFPGGEHLFVRTADGRIVVTNPDYIESNFHAFTSNYSEARGYTLNIAYIDEPPYVPKAAKVYNAIVPTVKTANGLLIIAGTLDGRDELLYPLAFGELEAA